MSHNLMETKYINFQEITGNEIKSSRLPENVDSDLITSIIQAECDSNECGIRKLCKPRLRIVGNETTYLHVLPTDEVVQSGAWDSKCVIPDKIVKVKILDPEVTIETKESPIP